MLKLYRTIVGVITLAGILSSPGMGANYDESKVPDYTLPEVLVCNDGTKVSSAQIWNNKRRPEILAMFEEQMFGKAPAFNDDIISHVVAIDNTALGGKAVRKEVGIIVKQNGKAIRFNMLIYLPKDMSKPVGTFIGLNFRGNHSIANDPQVPLPRSWVEKRNDGSVRENVATEKGRGIAASRWPIEMILGRGYALATIYYGDIDPDFHDGYKNGIHALFENNTDGKRAADKWASIAGWTWGLSRAMDYFEIDPDIDDSKVAVIGHSRLGKTSLWAGATDPRFALVISNDSGCGGAALSRRAFGETVQIINNAFPHWFCDNYKKYSGKEGDMAFDQHMLIALSAPRPIYVASAVEDRWADPKGEFLSAKGAHAVYKLLGTDGLPADEMPKVNKPVAGTIGYHIRSGKHNVTDFDWEQYLNFADKHLGD